MRCVKFADQFQTPTQSPSDTIGYDAHKQKLKPAVEAFILIVLQKAILVQFI